MYNFENSLFLVSDNHAKFSFTSGNMRRKGVQRVLFVTSLCAIAYSSAQVCCHLFYYLRSSCMGTYRESGPLFPLLKTSQKVLVISNAAIQKRTSAFELNRGLARFSH